MKAYVHIHTYICILEFGFDMSLYKADLKRSSVIYFYVCVAYTVYSYKLFFFCVCVCVRV